MAYEVMSGVVYNKIIIYAENSLRDFHCGLELLSLQLTLDQHSDKKTKNMYSKLNFEIYNLYTGYQ